MLHLRLSAKEDEADAIGRRLERMAGVSRVLSAHAPAERVVVLTADVDPGSADELLAVLTELEVASDGYLLTRLDVVAPINAKRLRLATRGGFAWL